MAAAENSLILEWVDRGREPQLRADPRFPDGVDVDLSRGLSPTCRAALPYPAKRCGYWVVSCGACGLRNIVTTAGRADDPRSVLLGCLLPGRSAPQ